ncbi:MAG: LysM peptidoglycan-binding domain-containing protein [Bacteroidota bacterium]|nr:LysM peptidoglycan-binding domain-containing protein [Bacteroidota bacterium]
MTNKSLVLFLFMLLIHFAGLANPTDSLRIELRGGRKFIIHRVMKGETLAGIATRYGVDEVDITSNNALITAGVFSGQIIKVPVNEAKYGMIEVPPIVPLTDSRMPLAKTLPPPILSKANAADLAANGVEEPDTAETELKLLTPDSKKEWVQAPVPVIEKPKDTVIVKPAEVPVLAEPIPEKKFQIYVVASPQTVNHLANSFGVDVYEIIALNNLKNYRLKSGQKLKIPITEGTPIAKVEIPKPVEEPLAPIVKKDPPRMVLRTAPAPAIVKIDTAKVIPEPVKVIPEPVKVVPEPVVIAKAETPKPVVQEPKPKPVERAMPKTVIIREPNLPVKKVIPVEEPDETTEVFTNDSIIRSGLLTELSDAEIDRLDSAYTQPFGITYRVNDYNIQDYYYDMEAMKAANRNSIDVATIDQRNGFGDKNYFHLVKPGETIKSIAKKYKISVSDIANWNGIYQYKVSVGQELIVNSARARMTPLEMAMGSDTKKGEGIVIKEENHIGIAFYNPKTQFKGVYSNLVPKGKLVYILNRDNFEQYYGRVVGPLPKNVPVNTIIQIDNEIAKRLLIKNPTNNIEIWFGLIDSE